MPPIRFDVPRFGNLRPFSVTVDTPDEADRVYKTITSSPANVPPPVPAGPFYSLDHTAIQVLAVLREAGGIGLSADELMEKCGVDGPRALGGVMAGLNRRLIERGLQPRDVLSQLASNEAGSRWFPGDRIDDALRLLGGTRILELLQAELEKVKKGGTKRR